jgi:hypothetical protein
MNSFVQVALGYPTAVLTVLLGVVLVFWMLTLVGIFDFDGLDGWVENISWVASVAAAFGLASVPFSVVLGVCVLAAWTLCCLACMWLVPVFSIPWWITTLLLPASLALAVLVTAVVLRPLRGLFVVHVAPSNASLVGQRCSVLSTCVTDTFGQAEVARVGAPLNIDVRAAMPNELKAGSHAIISEYDPHSGRYFVEPI